MIEQADVIFVMERKHKQLLNQKFPLTMANKQLIVLDIEDNYRFGDAELIEILKSAPNAYL